MTRKEWKSKYRLMRVVRRETLKAVNDMLLFGTGFVQYPADGTDPRCLAPEAVYYQNRVWLSRENLGPIQTIKWLEPSNPNAW